LGTSENTTDAKGAGEEKRASERSREGGGRKKVRLYNGGKNGRNSNSRLREGKIIIGKAREAAYEFGYQGKDEKRNSGGEWERNGGREKSQQVRLKTKKISQAQLEKKEKSLGGVRGGGGVSREHLRGRVGGWKDTAEKIKKRKKYH